MNKFTEVGNLIRKKSKELVIDYMENTFACQKKGEGQKQAEIFRNCGFDWGEKVNAISSNQQYWVVALLRELEEEGRVERDVDTKKWRLK